MNIDSLPYEITEHIKDYLWGNIDTYKKKLGIDNWVSTLKKPYIINIDSAYFCSYCGEKKYILPENDICFPCERMIRHDNAAYAYNTWSGRSQGHFMLHHKMICLYAGKVAPLEKNILCVRQEYPYIHPRV